jgi:hypothetical protein
MRRLTIEAASLVSARGFYDALSGLGCELEQDDSGNFQVRVPIDGDRKLAAVLDALQRHTSRRNTDGHATLLELDGRSYLLERTA